MLNYKVFTFLPYLLQSYEKTRGQPKVSEIFRVPSNFGEAKVTKKREKSPIVINLKN